MINVDTLELTDFMSVKSASFDFTEGDMIVFFGENGMGKSAVIEALGVCFSGRKRGASFKDFVRLKQKAALIKLSGNILSKPITFDIKINNKTYGVPFERKITYGGITYKNSECEPLLDSLGLDYLQGVMFSIQGESNITSLKPKERSNTLKKIFNFELKEELGKLEKQRGTTQSKIETYNTQYDMLVKNEYETTALNRILSEESIQLVNQSGRILESKIAKLKASNDEIDKQLEKLRALELDETKAANEVDRITRELSAKNAEVANKSKQIDTAETELQTIQNKDKKEIADISIQEQQVKDLTAQVREQKNTTAKLLAEFKMSEQHLKTHLAGECSSCGNAIDVSKVPQLRVALKSAEVAYNESHGLVDVYAKQLSDVNEEIMKLKLANHKIEVDKTSNETRVLTLNRTIAEAKTVIKDLHIPREGLNTDLNEQNAKLSEIRSNIIIERSDASDVGEITSIEDMEAELLAINEKVQNNAILVAKNEEITKSNLVITKKEAENKILIDKLHNDRTAAQTSLKSLTATRTILETDLPNYVIIKACNSLEGHINKFIKNVIPGMSVRLEQAKGGVEFFYSMELSGKDEWLSTKMASGFEKALLAVSWRVALARAFKLKILLLDEVDEGASAAASRRLFAEIARIDDFDQIILISHKPDVISILKQESDNVLAYEASFGVFTQQ